MRRFLNIYQNFHYFASYWALKGTSPFIWTDLNPYPQAWFLPSLVEIGPVVLEKKSIEEKLTDADDADDGRIMLAIAYS